MLTRTRFLLLRFLMEEITDMISLGELNPKLRDIQDGIDRQKINKDIAVLEATYSYLMRKIHRQSPRSKVRAREVISWLLCAVRPLRSDELRHAFEVFKGGKVDVGDLIGDTRGLVTCDLARNTAQLCHPTARSYFRRAWKEDLPHRHTDVAETLLTCLNTDDGTKGGIYEYAALNWAYHVGDTGVCYEITAQQIKGI
jgi:hypothetical protein